MTWKSVTVALTLLHVCCQSNVAIAEQTGSAAGYRARPCGFDLDRNGIVGERLDRAIANGRTSDPDGDGVDEDLIYVDADRGDDERGDGSATRPWRTIRRAMSACDGPQDGAEDIVCISGVFHESVSIPCSGVPGHVVIDGFQYPRDPFMLIGWDRDGDGEFPPYDRDDVAVIDGSRPGQPNRSLAVSNRDGNHSHIEIAHLTIRNFGHDAPKPKTKTPRAAFAPASDGNVSHIYMHDVAIESINEGALGDGYGHVVYFWIGRTRLNWFAFENNRVERFSGYGFRGVAANGSGHFRLQGNTFRPTPGRTSRPEIPDLGTLWKVWNSYNHLEFISNLVEGCPTEHPRSLGGTGFGVRPGVQDVTIRGNRFVNLKVSIGVDGNAPGYGQERRVDRVLIEDNVIVNDWKNYPDTATGGPLGIYLPEGGDLKNTIGDVTIRNNTLRFAQPNARGILCSAGNTEGPQPGTVSIEGNRFIAPNAGRDYYSISLQTRVPFPLQRLTIADNHFTHSGDQGFHIVLSYTPNVLRLDRNGYTEGAWKWGRQQVTSLRSWQSVSQHDAHSHMVLESPGESAAP